MTDIFSYLQTDATRFATRVGVTGAFGPLGGQSATTFDTLILQPFFVGTDGLTLTSCGLFSSDGSGTNIAQFGVYGVSPALARDVYPKNLIAESNPATYSATGVVWSSGWVGGAPSIALTNGLYYVAALIGGAGTRLFGCSQNPFGYSDASFWLGFSPIGRYPYFGFHTPHTSGTSLPASFPAGASLFTGFEALPRGVFVGMR
jgi:hypothetical protein